MLPDPEPTAEQGVYLPSPSARVREQVALYEATEGREGGTLEDKPVVILTTVGAMTGNIRKTPVMRIKHADTNIVVASAAGATTHPAWYRNLLAHSQVRLQDGATVHRVRAREVFGEEKARWWPIAEQHWPHFPEYRAKAAGREIPIMLLEPESTPNTATKEHIMDRQPKTPGADHPITIEPTGTHIVASSDGRIVADTTKALILREAGYPQVYYVPLTDVDQTLLRPSPTTTYCPYKGDASYYSLAGPDGDIQDAVWTYTEPYPAVAAIAGHVAFYPELVQISATER
jgi:deazaflavin-dependent oxidoreductase (nitroreductase family)